MPKKSDGLFIFLEQIMKRILMGCSNFWDSPLQVGSHHLARGFANAGWKVAFVSDPISPFHFLGKNLSLLNQRKVSYLNGGSWNAQKTIWSYVPGTLIPPHNNFVCRSEWAHRKWLKYAWPDPLCKLIENGFEEVDVLYVDSPIHAVWLKEIDRSKSIYRIPDNQAGFQKTTLASQKIESELVTMVDLVVYSSKALEEPIRVLRPKGMRFLTNGVDLKHFAKKTQALPLSYESIPHPIAVYVGTIAEWFDFDLLHAIAKALPQVSFVIIGPGIVPCAQFNNCPNVFFLGSLPYNELPAYLHHSNIGIIPFNVRDNPKLIPYVNPLKLYEYMACNLPVVSTKWKELEELRSPAVLCSTPEEFIEGIRYSLSKNWGQELVEFVRKYDWGNQVKELLWTFDS